MDATVVKLGPAMPGNNIQVVSFEEAFGEHSEFRGRGRARRQKRKLSRISRRGERKAARQANRAAQQEARQERKDTRKSRRVARKAMGDEDDGSQDDSGQYDDQSSDQGGGYAQDSGYQDQQDQGDGYAQDSGYQDQEGYAQDDGGDDNSDVMDQFTDDSSESFDGDADSNDFTSDANGSSMAVGPTIGSITSKIVWNQEAKRRAIKQKNDLNTQRQANKNDKRALSALTSQMSDLSMQINNYDNRIEELQKQLKPFGDHPHIAKGFHMANTELQKVKEKKSNADDSKKVKETIVSKSLDPQFGENRIDIPAYPELNKIEIKSSADGSGGTATGTGSYIVSAAIVVGLVAMVVYMAKK